MSTTIVVVAGVASLANPALAGAVSSSATGTRAATPPSVHRYYAPPYRRDDKPRALHSGDAAARVYSPGLGCPNFTPGPRPPGLCPLQASEYDVVVGWYDRADNANSFIVYRLEPRATRRTSTRSPRTTRPGAAEPYSWTDTDTDQSGQCYMIAAVDAEALPTARWSAPSGPTPASSRRPMP